ncbi:MAG: hypothetical protein ABI690_15895 [Chloroflexota bacterium]
MDFPLIHHQTPVLQRMFWKTGEKSAKNQQFHTLFCGWVFNSRLQSGETDAAVYEYLFSKNPPGYFPAQYPGVFAAPLPLRGKSATTVHPAVAA